MSKIKPSEISRLSRYLSHLSYIPEKRTFKGQAKFVKLYRVYDGDTIEIITKLDVLEKKRRYMLRLSNIDTPELKPKLNVQNRQLIIETGEKIKSILSNVLTPILFVEFDGEDKYGRLMGTVYNTEKNWSSCFLRKPLLNVNNWLLINRLAQPYNGATKKEFTRNWLVNNSQNIDNIYTSTRVAGNWKKYIQ